MFVIPFWWIFTERDEISRYAPFFWRNNFSGKMNDWVEESSIDHLTIAIAWGQNVGESDAIEAASCGSKAQSSSLWMRSSQIDFLFSVLMNRFEWRRRSCAILNEDFSSSGAAKRWKAKRLQSNKIPVVVEWVRKFCQIKCELGSEVWRNFRVTHRTH